MMNDKEPIDTEQVLVDKDQQDKDFEEALAVIKERHNDALKKLVDQ